METRIDSPRNKRVAAAVRLRRGRGRTSRDRILIDGAREVGLALDNDVEVLEDLIVAAANDAKAKIEVHVAEQMRELTGGLSLPPGFKLPM